MCDQRKAKIESATPAYVEALTIPFRFLKAEDVVVVVNGKRWTAVLISGAGHTDGGMVMFDPPLRTPVEVVIRRSIAPGTPFAHYGF